MSRSRNIKPGFFKNEVLVQLPFEQRLLFIGLWTLADRDGRFEDRPTRIKMEIFPADNVDVDAGLQALHDNGFVLRYLCDGGKYCQILAWAKHQNPHHKEILSTIPKPDLGRCQHLPRQVPAPEIPERALLIPDSLNLIPDSLKEPSCSNSEKPSSNEAIVESLFSPEEPTPEPTPTPPTVSRKAKATPKPSHEAEKLAGLLSGEIRRNAPAFRVTPGQQRKWAKTADRMLRLDHRNYDDVADIIVWVQHDEFWRSNVLSMDKLRDKFDQLLLKAEPRRPRPSEGPRPAAPTPPVAPDPLLECRVCRKNPATYMGPTFGTLCIAHIGRVAPLPSPGGAA